MSIDHTQASGRSPLLAIAQTLVAAANLRPAKAEQFVADWLSECSHDLQDEPSALRDLVNTFSSRWIDYLSTDQQARFVLDNLPSVVALHNFKRCLAALVEQASDPVTITALQDASEAVDRLTDWPLRAVLGDLAGPIIDPQME